MVRLKDIDLESNIGKGEVYLKFMLKSKELKKAKNGTQFLDITGIDGEVAADIKFWECDKQMFEQLEIGKVYAASVAVTIYNAAISLIGKEIKILDESSDTYANILKNRDEYNDKFTRLINSVRDDYYRNLIKGSLGIVGINNFLNGIGGLRIHHSEIGGLLRHTVEVAEITLGMCEMYEKNCGGVNRDLALAGALLHDIGKVYEYTVDLGSYSASYNSANLSGHIVAGVGIIGQAHTLIKDRDLVASSWQDSEEKFKLITNIVASHHGLKDWGAVEQPKILESEIVFISDYISSKFDTYSNTLNKLKVGGYDSKFNIYKHKAVNDI